MNEIDAPPRLREAVPETLVEPTELTVVLAVPEAVRLPVELMETLASPLMETEAPERLREVSPDTAVFKPLTVMLEVALAVMSVPALRLMAWLALAVSLPWAVKVVS